MKIVITGGGSGGHFYPLIAVADKIVEIAEDKKILRPEIYYLADVPYDDTILFRKDIIFKRVTAGKMRTYFSWGNITGLFTTLFGTIKAIFLMFSIYPDVVFTNGSYISMPVLIACKILRIPVLVHASDTVPGRAVLFGGKFAKKISIAFKEAAPFFPEKQQKNIALLGNPIRDEILKPLHNGAHEFLELDPGIPTILVLGGSQGAQAMNDAIVDALPKLLMRYNIIHQCGKNNHDEVFGRSEVVLYDHPYKVRYKLYPYLDDLAIRMSVGASQIIIARSGAGAIAEVANWGVASIMIPIPKKISRDQEKNAFAYARSGACVVMLQANLSANLLLSEIERLTTDDAIRSEMEKSAREFSLPNASTSIAEAVLNVALDHEG